MEFGVFDIDSVFASQIPNEFCMNSPNVANDVDRNVNVKLADVKSLPMKKSKKCIRENPLDTDENGKFDLIDGKPVIVAMAEPRKQDIKFKLPKYKVGNQTEPRNVQVEKASEKDIKLQSIGKRKERYNIDSKPISNKLRIRRAPTEDSDNFWKVQHSAKLQVGSGLRACVPSASEKIYLVRPKSAIPIKSDERLPKRKLCINEERLKKYATQSRTKPYRPIRRLSINGANMPL